MPITLPALSRRKFLGTTAGASLALLARRSYAAGETDPHRFFLLSDTHIAADPKTNKGPVNMHDNLKQVCGELLEAAGGAGAGNKAAAILLNGDCAYSTGEVGDYATFTALLKPLRESGMPIHLTLGNHDRRDRFWDAIKSEKDSGNEPGKVVEERYVSVVEAPRANWFILDSLDKTNVTPGVVGQKQVDWLSAELDKRKDKPALVMVHHNPVFKNPNADAEKPAAKNSGITDTEILWAAIGPRAHVKALIFGHTHNWSLTKREGIHLINLPTVAYPFTPGKANGWVDCKLAEKRMELTLTCIDKTHKQNGEKQTVEWR
ncbi:MAG TPA: metallophosphoesterase [Planctomycetota bacterium]|nr:metallophosphoesterase [Planctomycetota bacterium]